MSRFSSKRKPGANKTKLDTLIRPTSTAADRAGAVERGRSNAAGTHTNKTLDRPRARRNNDAIADSLDH